MAVADNLNPPLRPSLPLLGWKAGKQWLIDVIAGVLLAGCVHTSTPREAPTGTLLMKVLTVDLNNAGDPSDKPVAWSGNLFRFVNRDTKDALVVTQASGYVKADVPAGTYCFYDFFISATQTVPLHFPICLLIKPGVINNAGTWTLGSHVGKEGWYARIVEAEKDLDDVLRLSNTPKDNHVIEVLGVRSE